MAGASTAVVFGASAGYGFTKAAECAKAEDAANAQLNAIDGAIETANEGPAKDGAAFQKLWTTRDTDGVTALRLQLGASPPLELRFQGVPQRTPEDVCLTIVQRSATAVYASCQGVMFDADGTETQSTGGARYESSMAAPGTVDEELSVVVTPETLAPLVYREDGQGACVWQSDSASAALSAADAGPGRWQAGRVFIRPTASLRSATPAPSTPISAATPIASPSATRAYCT